MAGRLTSVDLREKFDVRVTLESKYRIDFGRVVNERDFAQKLALAEQILAEGDIDPDEKYIVSVGDDQPYRRPAGDEELDLTEQ